MIMHNINLRKKYEFYDLNYLGDFDVSVRSIVLLPSTTLDDEKYRLFNVVAIDDKDELLGMTPPFEFLDFGDITFGKIDLLNCGLFRIQFSEICKLNSLFKRLKGGEK